MLPIPATQDVSVLVTCAVQNRNQNVSAGVETENMLVCVAVHHFP